MVQAISNAVKFTVELDLLADPFTHVMSIQATSGGSRADSAVIAIQGPGIATDRLQNETLLFSRFDQKLCAVYVQNDPNDPNDRTLLHYGITVAGNIQIGGDRHLFNIVSRTEDYFISRPLEDILFSDRIGQAQSTDLPLVFNPIIDGITVPNNARNTGFNAFIHPDQPPSMQRDLWTLGNAINYMLRYNTGEVSGVRLAPGVDLHEIELRNVKLEFGIFLPAALDKLLHPYGFDWKLFPLLIDDVPKLEIQIWQRSVGLGQHFIELQAIGPNGVTGSAPVPRDNTLENGQINVDIAEQAATAVQVYGDPLRFEITAELSRGWDEADETFDPAMLEVGSPDWETSPNLSRVYRDYVFNESGEYAHASVPDITDITDRSELTRRRRFFPCISLGADGKPIGRNGGYELEYHNGHQWQIVDEPWQVLENECGIRFTSKQLASWSMREQRLRITACIESDELLDATAPTVNHFSSVHNVEKKLVIQTEGQFEFRKRFETAPYRSRYLDLTTVPPAAEVDNQAEITMRATQLAAVYGRPAMISEFHVREEVNEFTIENLGNRVEKIIGREISLFSNDGGYPIITGVIMNIQDQLTTYFLDNSTGAGDA